MGAIENMAIILAAIVLIKLVWIWFNPKGWFEISKKLLQVNQFIWLALALLTGWYLLETGLTVVQIAAVTLFVSLLMLVSYSLYSKEMLKLSKEMLAKKDVFSRAWLPILVWIIFSLWVLKDIFMR